MGFVAFTILFCGALAVVAGSGCVVETAECIQFWEKIEPHKGLFETERELNAWCSKRSAFYDCLVNVLLAGKDGDVSHLPRNLLLSKIYAEDLCKPGSISRRRYLNDAACINQLNTEFCTSPEYLDIDRADGSVPSKISLAEKTLDCIAASMIMNCGFDAGRLYRTMLMITRYNDEVCDVEASQSTLHKTGAKDMKSKEGAKLSEVYYDLVDRLGNIPGQVDSVEMPGNSEEINVEASQSTLHDKMEAKDTKLKGGAKLSKVYYDFVDRLGNLPGQVDSEEMPGNSEDINVEASQSTLLDKTDAKDMKSKGGAKLSKVYYDFVDRLGNIQRQVEMPGNSEEINESEGTSYEMITEAIKTALDRLDKDVEASQSTLHKMGAKDAKLKGGAKLSQVYYDFVDRLGNIPGQVDSVEMPGNSGEINVEASQSRLHDKMDAIDTTLKGGAKLSKVYYDFIDRLGNIPGQEVDSVEMPRNSEEINESEGTNREMITEAIKTALDRLDEDPEDPRNHTVIRIKWEVIGSSLYTPDVPKRTDIKPYRKYPLITEVYKGILFYNYSDHEYAIYWRQPDFTNVDKVTCRHLQRSYMRGVVFQCIFDHRTKDPDCVSNETVHEPVTPELIRDIDPDVPYDSIVDFAHPRPEWMRSMDEAKEAKRLRDLMSSTTTESPEYSLTINPEASTASTLLHVTETIVKASERFRDTGLEERRWEIPDAHKDFNMMIPNHVHSELMSLFIPDPENFEAPAMFSFESGDQMYSYLFDPYPSSHVENLTCTRLVECHPRARGVFRCTAFPRKIEICEECGRGPPVDNLAEASGEEDSHSSEEVITLLFSGDEESETYDPSESSEQSTFYTESNYMDLKSEVDSSVLDALLGDNRLQSSDEVLSNNVDGFVNDVTEEASHLDFPTVQIVLEQDSKSQYDDSSDYVSKLVYSVDDVKRIGDEPISNGLESSDEVLSDSDDGFVKDMPEEASHLDFPTVQIVVLEQDSKSQYDDSSDYVPKLVYSVDDVKRIGDEPISEFTLSADNYGLFNDNVILIQDAPDNIENEYTFVDISDD